jgi:hypothetical protein
MVPQLFDTGRYDKPSYRSFTPNTCRLCWVCMDTLCVVTPGYCIVGCVTKAVQCQQLANGKALVRPLCRGFFLVFFSFFFLVLSSCLVVLFFNNLQQGPVVGLVAPPLTPSPAAATASCRGLRTASSGL